MNKVFKPRTLTLLRYNLRCNEREHKSTIPAVTLAGKWMYEAGFRSGQKIRIIVQERELIIRIESDPEPTGGHSVIEWERKHTSWNQPPQLHPELAAFRRIQRIKKKELRERERAAIE
ncbi:MAG: type I toxin-antitoxin system SymE family toxin [Tannerellaceae bacterium]|nr:type I toxin-antitoxin system SymE family toxin [Tannerellaceae bacterium]